MADTLPHSMDLPALQTSLTLFEAIEQEDENAIIELLDRIILIAHEGALEPDDIYDILAMKELTLGPSIKQLIHDRLVALEATVKDKHRT